MVPGDPKGPRADGSLWAPLRNWELGIAASDVGTVP